MSQQVLVLHCVAFLFEFLGVTGANSTSHAMLFEDEAKRALRLTMDIAERSIDAMFAVHAAPSTSRPPLVRRRTARELGPSTPTMETRGRSRSRSHGGTTQGRRPSHQPSADRPRSAHQHRTRTSHRGERGPAWTRVPPARPRRPTHPAPLSPAPRSSQAQRRMFGGGVSTSGSVHGPSHTSVSHPIPSLAMTFPAGFHIGGLASAPSPAAVESVLSTLAARSFTFQSLQPLHQLVPANARRRVTAYLLSHPQFLDTGLVKRIMEEWHGGTIPANSQGVTIPTSVGDLRITLASRIVRQLDTAAPTSTPDSTLQSTEDGNADAAPRTGEPPNHNTADLPAPVEPSELTRSGMGLATPIVRNISANAESASGPSPLPPQSEAEGTPLPAPSTEGVSSMLPAPAPPSSEVSVPSAAAVPPPALDADVAGLAPPHHSVTRASPPSADSAGIAPMTPPMDCELTPQLRGAEYVLGANCLLPITNCTSCLQPFQVGETLVRLMCMHYFHKECVTRWFSSPIHGHRCPSCNVNLIGLDS